MSVVLSMREMGPCRKQVRVEIPAEEVASETDRVAREFGRSVKLPGFRKGKVPAHLVRQRFRDEIDQEVLDRLVPRFWRRAQEESDIQPLLPPQVEEVVHEPGQPITFLASVETRPRLEIQPLDDVELPEMEVEPTEDEVAEALEQVRRQAADWKPVERPAARGDGVRFTMVELAPDGEPLGEPRQMQTEIGEQGVWEELSLALTGLVAEQETEFTRREREPEPRERRFRVRLEEARERELPPLDDALAKRVGNLESLEDLRQAVRRDLERAKREERRRRREQALFEELRRRHPVELPPRVVDHEIEQLLQDYAENLVRQGVDLERASIDWRALGEEIRPQAGRRVHTRLVLDAVAEAEGVDVEAAELERLVAALASAQGRTAPELRAALERDGRLAALRAQYRREKVVRKLLGEETGQGSAGEEPAEEGER